MQEEDLLEHERDQGLGLSRSETNDDSDAEMVFIVGDLRGDYATDEEQGAGEDEHRSASYRQRDGHKDEVADALRRD